MTFQISYGHFDTETEALAEAAQLGLSPVTVDFEAENSDLHWHDFASRVYVTDGNVRIETVDGQTCELHRGDMIEADARVVHREITRGYRAVIGFAADPTSLSRPINKDPAELS
ncbi:MAG: cupin domain-containing protein [Acidimicrobiia bacterium]|nr:cupin domain-containing protein [Acidimicrobiia bacterium]MDH5239044.1 cupin domain-containing protein [Acidimicrobiia bacterium]